MKLEISLLILNLFQFMLFWIFFRRKQLGEVTQKSRLGFIFFGLSGAILSLRQIVEACPNSGFNCLISIVDVLTAFEGEKALNAINALLLLSVVENGYLTLKVVRQFNNGLVVEAPPTWKVYLKAAALGGVGAITLTVACLLCLYIRTIILFFGDLH